MIQSTGENMQQQVYYQLTLMGSIETLVRDAKSFNLWKLTQKKILQKRKILLIQQLDRQVRSDFHSTKCSFSTGLEQLKASEDKYQTCM